MQKNITIIEKYAPGMKITEQAEADQYFEKCVEHCMKRFQKTREEAEVIEKFNIGYFAGYYDRETRKRVEKLFKAAHPFLGTVEDTPLPEDIFKLGYELGRKAQ